jgi:hypothetical protein
VRHDFLTIHASDPHACLACAKAKILDGLDTEGEPAKTGTAVHRVAETVAHEVAERPLADVHEIARAELKTQSRVLKMSAGAVVDAAAMLRACLALDSRVTLWPRMGWSGRPEWKWALDEDLEVVEPCGACGGDGPNGDQDTPPCSTCNGTGWSRPTLAAGTIDLAEWVDSGRGGLAWRDYKTTVQMFSATDAFESFQVRLYGVSLFRRFPEAQRGEGGFSMLRHGYVALADFVRGDLWEEQTVEQVRAEREVRRGAVETGLFPETPGLDCHYCPVLLKCQTARRYAEMGAEAIGALAPDEAARAWLAAKAIAARLEKFVRAHVEATGLPIALRDPHGNVLGFKEVEGKETLLSYESTMEALRTFGMTDAMFVDHFRFVAPNHFAARVRKVASEILRLDRETLERLVVPVTKTEFTTYVPAPLPKPVALMDGDELFDHIDKLLDGG